MDNRQQSNGVIRSLFWSAGVVLAGFFVLTVVLVLINRASTIKDDASSPQSSIVLSGSSFRPVQVGDGSPVGESYEIRQAYRGQSIVTTDLNVSASAYSAVEAKLSGVQNNQTVMLYWRSSNDLQRLAFTPLSRSSKDTFTLNMDELSAWSGNISELAIGLTGAIKSPVLLQRVRLGASSVFQVFGATMQDWLKTRKWSPVSINILYGSDTYTSPALFFGLLLFASVTIARVIHSRTSLGSPFNLRSVTFGCVAICCLALDGLWLNRAVPQSFDTVQTLAGNTLREKKLQDFDSEIFKLINTGKIYYMPDTPQNVLILSAEAPQALLSRAFYHFLPDHTPLKPVSSVTNAEYRSLIEDADFLFVMHTGLDRDGSPQAALQKLGLAPSNREKLLVAGVAGALYRLDNPKGTSSR
ncbi:hypothetical protein R0137_17025 [Congregibacter brevis]|uniref:Uncharacterized protein n=1 Tax=Congregibacter brevis TaxID=3081201 RepID=A0ABZ0IE23_9GAMM|nr:hypothetical protein R0137_17025 [Congregibacter sp. IMCC45268]